MKKQYLNEKEGQLEFFENYKIEKGSERILFIYPDLYKAFYNFLNSCVEMICI